MPHWIFPMLRLALVCTALAGVRAVPVARKIMNMSGLSCDGPQNALVLYPDDDQKYPLVSFEHGAKAFMVESCFGYKYLLENMAKEGYVVVADRANRGYCKQNHLDQMRGLEWAMQTPEVLAHIDTKAGAGIVGHSWGGGATLRSASNATAIAAFNIKVAVGIEPAWGKPDDPQIPTVYLTGTSDETIPSSKVREQYDNATSEKHFVNVVGANHFDVAGCGKATRRGMDIGANTLTPFVFSALNCYLKSDREACKGLQDCSVEGNVSIKECLSNKSLDAPAGGLRQFILTI